MIPHNQEEGSGKPLADAARPRRILALDEWRAEAEKLFGAEENKWRFRCPGCGGVQTMEEFAATGAPGSQVLGNCIGRFAEGRGCKFRIGTAEVLFGRFTEVRAADGDVMPVFDFAPLPEAKPADLYRVVDVSTPKYPSALAIVDAQDFERVSAHTWHAQLGHRTLYARARINDSNVFMHRFILGLDNPEVIDHRDGNGLNNTRANIRFASQNQNSTNRQATKSRSGYRGVRQGKYGKWYAEIKVKNKTIHLGTFSDPKEGAKKYNEAALALHGEFAWLNEI